jgi:hypothetical protein
LFTPSWLPNITGVVISSSRRGVWYSPEAAGWQLAAAAHDHLRAQVGFKLGCPSADRWQRHAEHARNRGPGVGRRHRRRQISWDGIKLAHGYPSIP